MSFRMPSGRTPETLYHPALDISQQAEARAYLLELVGLAAARADLSRTQALRQERENLAYYAGYFTHEVRLRVERLFGAVHPILGSAEGGPMDPEVARALGQRLAEAHQGKRAH